MSGFSETESWRFRPDIEGLRAVAILGVILFHAGLSRFSGGFLGVDVFFVLSGFLITGILFDEVRRTGTLSLAGFWARRARRLLPAASLVSVVTLLFLVRLDSPFAERRFVGSALSFATYWSNLLFWRRGANYFDQSVGSDPFLHTWSLAVEEQYYLLFAPCVLLLALTVRQAGAGLFQRRLRAVALGASTLSLFGYLVLTRLRPVFAFYAIPTRAWEFGIGSLLALTALRPLAIRRQVTEALGALALAAVVGAWFLAKEGQGSGLLTLLPVLGTATLIELGSRGSTVLGGLLHTAPLRWLGRLSYSWYLWHWPLTVYWDKLLPGNPVPLALGMPLLSLGLAQATYTMVEHPTRIARWLQPARRGLLAALVLAATTSLFALAVRWRAERRLRSSQFAFILEARDARTRVHEDGCDREQGDATLQKCSYGAPGSATSVVLFGDSHAAQWFPALEPLARQRGWRLVALTRPGCPSVFVTVWTQMDRSPAFCERWRETSLQRIRELNPALVIVSNSRRHALLDGGHGAPEPAGARPDLWRRGLERSLAALPPGSGIVLLEDSPTPRFDVPTCLVEHVRNIERCAFARDSALVPLLTQVEQELGRRDPRVRYADLTDLICEGKICPAAHDHLARYADDSHLSVGFVATLAARLGHLLDSVVAEPGGQRSRKPGP